MPPRKCQLTAEHNVQTNNTRHLTLSPFSGAVLGYKSNFIFEISEWNSSKRMRFVGRWLTGQLDAEFNFSNYQARAQVISHQKKVGLSVFEMRKDRVLPFSTLLFKRLTLPPLCSACLVVVLPVRMLCANAMQGNIFQFVISQVSIALNATKNRYGRCELMAIIIAVPFQRRSLSERCKFVC